MRPEGDEAVNSCPKGENTMLTTPSCCQAFSLNCCPVQPFQRRTAPASVPVTKRRPSGLKAAAVTADSCSSRLKSLPSWGFHKCASLSSEQLTAREAAPLSRRQLTWSRCCRYNGCESLRK